VISDDDLQRIVLGDTPEGRVLARALKRLAALEAAQAKTQALTEKSARLLIALGQGVIREAAPLSGHEAEHETNIARVREIANAIRQDLAETDRTQPPKEKPCATNSKTS